MSLNCRCATMSKKNMCAVLYGPKDLRLEEREIPKPSLNEVLIIIRNVGICGSDSSLFRSGRIGLSPLQSPIILGHEPCGLVCSLGDDVTQLTVGDRVALAPYQGCGTCTLCQEGRPNICPHIRMMAAPPTDGSLSTYVVWPEKLCYKLPPTISWKEGALVQPMALALYGCQRAGVKPGHHVLICGAGPLGIIMAVVARSFGATRICVTDICKERLQFVSSVLCCLILHVKKDTPSAIADQVALLLGGNPDVTIECSGAASAVSVGIHATKPGGCILLAGLGQFEVQIPLLVATSKELDIRSMFRFANTYPQAIDLIESGLVDVKPLVTQTFHLSNVVEAMEAMENKVEGKIVVQCSED